MKYTDYTVFAKCVFLCVDNAETPRKVRSAVPAPAPTTTTTAAASAAAATVAACVVNGNDDSVIDLTMSDDETVPVTTACTAAACARTNGFVSKSPQPAHGTVSYSAVSRAAVSSPSPPVAVFDLSPLNIPVSSSPVLHHNLPPSPLMVPTPPLLPPSLGPSGFHPAFPAPSAKISSIPYLGGSSSSSLSSSSSAYSTLPSSAAAPSSLHYPTNSLFGRSSYDSEAMLDFLTLMSGFSDFGGFQIPSNAFDYLYQSPVSNASSRGGAVDFGLDSVLRSSPSPTI